MKRLVRHKATSASVYLHFYCVHILHNKNKNFIYIGYSENIKSRVIQHNKGLLKVAKSGVPWRLVWYAGFGSRKEARDFEIYLKTGSGKAFAYKRLVDIALMNDGK